MLGCWATHGDKMNSGQCAEAALSLQQCMANNAGRKGKVRKPSINYRESASVPCAVALEAD